MPADTTDLETGIEEDQMKVAPDFLAGIRDLIAGARRTVARGVDLVPSPPRPFTLSWSHFVFLLAVKDPNKRSFYEIEASAQDWPLCELKRQFNSGLYERLALSRDREGIRRLALELKAKPSSATATC
jgi:hypothetical protein